MLDAQPQVMQSACRTDEKKKETNEKKKQKALVDPSCPATPTLLEKAPFDLACDFEGCASDTFDEP
jgi:hypothetical protein